MSGVVSALKAHHDVRPLREQVGDLSLSFVAPLGAHDGYAWHGWLIMAGCLEPVAKIVAEERQRVAADLDQARHGSWADLLLERRLVEVGGHDHGALGLVPLVDDRVELLQNPVRSL